MQPTEVKQSADAAAVQPSAGWAHWLTLLLVFAGGTTARFLYLSGKPFWFDECFSVEVAQIDWRNFLHLLWWREANMSLYYVLLRLWLHFGESPFFIRSLSVVISAAGLPAIYWAAKQLYDRRIALFATALLSFNAYSIRYAQEARSYALFALLATLSSGFLVAFLQRPTRRSSIAYVLISTLAVYAHFYALLLVMAHWLAVRWGGIPAGNPDREGTARQLRRAWTMIAIAVLPLLIFVAKTGAGPIRWIHRPGIADLLHFSLDLTNRLPLVYLATSLLALVPIRKTILARSGSWETWRVRFLCLWLMYPIVLTVVLSFARPVFLARYMIFCIPAMLILASAGLAHIRPAWLSAILACAVLILSARFAPYVYGHDYDDERDSSGGATNFILDHAQPGDAIFFHIAETRVPYEFSRSLRAGQNTAGPNFSGILGPEILFPHHGRGLDYRDFTGKPTADFVRTATASHNGVWVMLMNNGTAEKPDPTTVMFGQVLPESFSRVQRWQFARVEVRLYSKPQR